MGKNREEEEDVEKEKELRVGEGKLKEGSRDIWHQDLAENNTLFS